MSDAIARWHAYMRAPSAEALHDLLADDVVFRSPAVHTPQRGRAVTTKYLLAAAEVLGGPDFRYTGEWRAERSAVLEFECVIGEGVQVNGVDIVAWDEAGRITDFKVMVRPIKALQTLVPLMGAVLMRGEGGGSDNVVS